jgi:hypothetical protein
LVNRSRTCLRYCSVRNPTLCENSTMDTWIKPGPKGVVAIAMGRVPCSDGCRLPGAPREKAPSHVLVSAPGRPTLPKPDRPLGSLIAVDPIAHHLVDIGRHKGPRQRGSTMSWKAWWCLVLGSNSPSHHGGVSCTPPCPPPATGHCRECCRALLLLLGPRFATPADRCHRGSTLGPWSVGVAFS